MKSLLDGCRLRLRSRFTRTGNVTRRNIGRSVRRYCRNIVISGSPLPMGVHGVWGKCRGGVAYCSGLRAPSVYDVCGAGARTLADAPGGLCVQQHVSSESVARDSREDLYPRGCAGLVYAQVIPDTGADASALPWADCAQLALDPSQGVPGLIGGVGGTSASTLVFAVWASLDRQTYPCRLQTDFTGDEHVLGRDVLDRLDILFRGPHQEVVINP